ncbi:MAG TPA: energy transducer TonB [Steroidobacteraceae bacterium]|nr:energy transducer TonB [Steroidobacteraceae bacterium]
MSLTYSLHQPRQTLPRTTAVAAVILIHAVALIAFNNGFARWPAVLGPIESTYVDVKADPPKVDPLPPLNPSHMLDSTFKPQQLQLPKPDLNIEPDIIPPAQPDISGIHTGDVTGQHVVPPVPRVTLLHRVDPHYPAGAQRAGEQGTVLLQVLIDAGGRVRNVNVIQSSGFSELDAAALEAVKQWHFAPLAADAMVRVPIKFELSSLQH